MTREDLLRALEMFAKNWLAHDGCWFLAAEERLGMQPAIELDERAWERFAAVEAQRITTTFRISQNGGLAALEKAFGLRMYSLINAQRVEWSNDRERLRLVMDVCRVQETRRRKGLNDFPCKRSARSSSKRLPKRLILEFAQPAFIVLRTPRKASTVPGNSALRKPSEMPAPRRSTGT